MKFKFRDFIKRGIERKHNKSNVKNKGVFVLGNAEDITEWKLWWTQKDDNLYWKRAHGPHTINKDGSQEWGLVLLACKSE